MKDIFFAADLGATSGRTILQTLADGRLEQEELTRFDNPIIQTGGHYYWDILALYREILQGLRLCAQRRLPIRSIGIDTWGVDFVCIGEDGQLLRAPLSYRDPHSVAAMEGYLRDVAGRKQVYNLTGIQFMNFNTLFQLYGMRREGSSALAHARRILFMPDALIWMLTGQEVCESSIASTSQLLNPRTGDLDASLLESVGLQRSQFAPMVQPGTVVGPLSQEVQRLTGLGPVPVVAVAGHDTASAVAAVPASSPRFAYLSSGTWSLMGIETEKPIITADSFRLNFTNEGGIDGTTRFLKNICGMWLYERCRAEWKEAGLPHLSHKELQDASLQEQPFRSIIKPDDEAFAAPESMTRAITQSLRQAGQPVPETPAQFCRCIYDSLALRYKEVFSWLQDFSQHPIDVLHIIGGGSQNQPLCQLTADVLGIDVLAGPQECTAMGNVMMQARALGIVGDVWEMRQIIARNVEIKHYKPQKS